MGIQPGRIVARALVSVLAIAFPLLAFASPARAEGPNAITTVPSATSLDSCRDTTLPRNDDGSAPVVALPFTIDFFGNHFSNVYVNNNGNLTFTSALSTYTPFGLSSARTPIIAPFFADVDTRGVGSGLVTYAGRSFGIGTFAGRPAFCANWVNVGYYSAHTDKLNSFQAILVDRSDIGTGDFDIVFNYDKVQWETGDASGGSGGLGGSPVRMGFSNGSTASFELPGSGVSRAFLDSNTATGLIHNSRNSLQLGRYIFNVRNGAAPTGGTIQGTVYRNSSASPENVLAGAYVQVCGSGGSCNLTTTNAAGGYTVSGLAADTYRITANGPTGTTLTPASRGPVTLVGTATLTGQDLVLTGPTPLPAGTTITQRGISAGLPVVYWQDNLTLRTTGCAGGSASYQMLMGTTVVRSGPMTEAPPGTYTAVIAALYPIHGYARIDITIVCAGVPSHVVFDLYIDPSGVVRTTTGAPIAGATVRLLRSDSSSGPFAAVPNGSGIMSIANRSNPDATDAVGHFGWDVIAGFYVVEASAPGCVSPTDPTQTVVRSAVLTIPPAVLDLDLRLACASRDTTAPVTIASPSPAPNANGWNNTNVTVSLTATDETGGSGVRDITYALTGAQILAATTLPGASASTTINAEGTTTVTYHAADNANNSEIPHGTTVRIDKTAPTVTGSRAPAANAAGWNNGSVSVHFVATDSGSGIDGASTFDATLATAGAGQSVTNAFSDRAGNSASATVGGINIDLTNPVTTATTTPGANVNGWWRSAMSVTLAATDDLSGVARTEYSLDGAAFAPYTAAVSVAAEGIHTFQYRSVDRAGNIEAATSLTIRIDLTAPEAYLSFDPATQDLVLTGRDGGSGPTTPVVTSVPVARHDDEDRRELRTYHVADRAGNTLDVVVAVKREGHELKATVKSLSYNGGAPITQPKNELEFEWSLTRSGALNQLEQSIEVKTLVEQEAEAHFNARTNTTKIKTERGDTERSFTRAGLSLLRLATDRGTLVIETD